MVDKIVLVVIVSVLLAIQPSTSSPIENEKLVEFSDQLNRLQNRVESLEVENEALKIRVDFLERKDFENEAKIRGQAEEIIQLKSKKDAKLKSIQSTGPSLDELVTDLRSSNDNTMSSIIGKEGSSDFSTRAAVPSSCRELSLIGHSLDGLYLVQNRDTKMVEAVLCIFGTLISQDFIGQVDVKTKTVHFFVQRNSPFSTTNAVIPFDVARLNQGNAFDLASGVFTVPVPGIYHFDLSALKDSSATHLDICLQVNGGFVGRAMTQTATGSSYIISLSASLRLATGDRVNLYNFDVGTLFDNGNHHTHFTGWLVEEELTEN